MSNITLMMIMNAAMQLLQQKIIGNGFAIDQE